MSDHGDVSIEGFDEFYIFLFETNNDIIELLKRVNGPDSHEVKLFYNLRQQFMVEPCSLKIQLEESCYRNCFPSVIFLTGQKKNDITVRDNLLYAVRFAISQLNAEYENCKFRQYSQEFEKGLEATKRGAIPPRCVEVRKMMRLILDTWTNVRQRLQEQRLAKGTTTVVRNRMVVNKKEKHESEYLNQLETHYHEINFAQLGLAAYNLNDYASAVFYLEECLQRNVTYTAGGRDNEFDADLDFPDLNITRQQVLDLLGCSYFHLNHHDQVAGLKKLGSTLSLVEESEILGRLRTNSDWHQLVDLCRQFTDVYTDNGIEQNFHDKAVESAIELGKWDEAEKWHKRRVSDTTQKQMGFDFYLNDLLFGLRGLLKIDDDDARDQKRKLLIDQVGEAESNVPLLLSPNTINQHRNENAVQRCLLNNIDILLKWLETPENREELEETVYAEWREKRLLFPLKEQDYMIEKECAILTVLTDSELLMLDEHRGLKSLSSSLLSMAHLKRSSICATIGDSARASAQIQKARKYADDDTYEWDIALQEAKQSHLFGSSAVGNAYDQLVRLCSDEKLIRQRISNERFRIKERLTYFLRI